MNIKAIFTLFILLLSSIITIIIFFPEKNIAATRDILTKNKNSVPVLFKETSDDSILILYLNGEIQLYEIDNNQFCSIVDPPKKEKNIVFTSSRINNKYIFLNDKLNFIKIEDGVIYLKEIALPDDLIEESELSMMCFEDLNFFVIFTARQNDIIFYYFHMDFQNFSFEDSPLLTKYDYSSSKLSTNEHEIINEIFKMLYENKYPTTKFSPDASFLILLDNVEFPKVKKFTPLIEEYNLYPKLKRSPRELNWGVNIKFAQRKDLAAIDYNVKYKNKSHYFIGLWNMINGENISNIPIYDSETYLEYAVNEDGDLILLIYYCKNGRIMEIWNANNETLMNRFLVKNVYNEYPLIFMKNNTIYTYSIMKRSILEINSMEK